MKTIFLIRHGEVEVQFQNRYNGWSDIDLSETGYNQIEIAAKSLGSIPLLISSDLKRCKNTVHSFSYESILFSNLIREKSWGKHEGMSFQEIEESGIIYESFDQFINALDGETIDEFRQRVLSFWQSQRINLPDRTAILTHGGVIREILAFEHEMSFEETFQQFHIDYGSITKLMIS